MTAKKKARKQAAADRCRDMPLRDDGQVYGRVTKMLGNGRVSAMCSDGQERQCRIRGSMRKREWVRVGDTVLVALREYADTKADVVFKYQDAEVHRLQRLGEDVVVQTGAEEDEGGADDAVAFEHDPDDPATWELI